MARTCNPSPLEVEVGDQDSVGRSRLPRKFVASLSYVRPCQGTEETMLRVHHSGCTRGRVKSIQGTWPQRSCRAQKQHWGLFRQTSESTKSAPEGASVLSFFFFEKSELFWTGDVIFFFKSQTSFLLSLKYQNLPCLPGSVCSMRAALFP